MIKLLCYPKEYKIGQTPSFELVLQAVQSFDVESENDITDRRIETGYQITDNAYVKPRTISASGIVGDLNRNPNRLWTGLYSVPILSKFQNKNYVENLKMGLERIRDNKMFIVVYNTKDGKFYYNFLVTKLSIKDSKKTTIGFEYSFTLKEAKIGTIGSLISTISKIAPPVNEEKGQGGVSDSSEHNSELESYLHGFGRKSFPVGSK